MQHSIARCLSDVVWILTWRNEALLGGVGACLVHQKLDYVLKEAYILPTIVLLQKYFRARDLGQIAPFLPTPFPISNVQWLHQRFISD